MIKAKPIFLSTVLLFLPCPSFQQNDNNLRPWGIGGPLGIGPIRLKGFREEVEESWEDFVEAVNNNDGVPILEFLWEKRHKKDPQTVIFPAADPKQEGRNNVLAEIMNKLFPINRYSIDQIFVTDESAFGTRTQLRAIQYGGIQIDSNNDNAITNTDVCGHYVVYWRRTHKKPRWKIQLISWTDLRGGDANECPLNLPNNG